jgi:hypothetical protein
MEPSLDKEIKLSVVTVSDYEPDGIKTWHDERKILSALSHQDINIDFEVILVESKAVSQQDVPTELYKMLPNLKVIYFDSDKSATLKDYGVSQSVGQYIAVLESDCVPSENWLQLLLEAVDQNNYDAASGRTFYGEENSYRRVMNLLHRSYDDPGISSATRFVSNNGAIYQRHLLEQYTYPDAATPFQSAEMRNTKMRNDGYDFYYERQVTMQHAIGDVSFIWDYQRNKGHQMMAIHKNRHPVSLLAKKMWTDFGNIFRIGTKYLNWYDWMLVPIIMLIDIMPFLIGAYEAKRQVSSLEGSAYR